MLISLQNLSSELGKSKSKAHFFPSSVQHFGITANPLKWSAVWLKNRFAKCTSLFPDLKGLMVKPRRGLNRMWLTLSAHVLIKQCEEKRLGQEMRLQNWIGK